MTKRETLTLVLCLALAGTSLVLALALALQGQHIRAHDRMVDDVSRIILGSIHESGETLSDLSTTSPLVTEQLLLLSYKLQAAENCLDVLRSDARFPGETLEGLSQQLRTSRIQFQLAVLQREYQGVQTIKPRLQEITGQFPDELDDRPTEMLITTLKALRLP